MTDPPSWTGRAVGRLEGAHPPLFHLTEARAGSFHRAPPPLGERRPPSAVKGGAVSSPTRGQETVACIDRLQTYCA